MAKFYEFISDNLVEFIKAQHVFFVASAPLSGGHVNLSPKGHDSFRILSSTQVAYLDLTGSGNETSAHLHENGRLTIMFTAFDGPPNILRLYGKGHVVLPGTAEWALLAPIYPHYTAARQIIVLDVDMVQTSCGFAVPFMEYVGERETHLKWAETKGEDGIRQYQQEKNSTSIDAMPTPIGINCGG